MVPFTCVSVSSQVGRIHFWSQSEKCPLFNMLNIIILSIDNYIIFYFSYDYWSWDKTKRGPIQSVTLREISSNWCSNARVKIYKLGVWLSTKLDNSKCCYHLIKTMKTWEIQDILLFDIFMNKNNSWLIFLTLLM